MKLICGNCGREYESCKTCEGAKNFAYRNFFCSILCFMKFEEGDNMRIEYDGKRYTLESYDHKNNKYKVKGLDLILKRKDIKTFMISSDDLEEALKLRLTKPKTKKVEEIVKEEE